MSILERPQTKCAGNNDMTYERNAIMQLFKQWYRNLKLHKKIMLLSFTVSLIPILILGILFIFQSRKLLVSREETYLHNILEQANSTLDHFLVLHNNVINSLVWDTSIINAANRVYENNYEMFLINRELFDSKIPIVEAMHKEIKSITLYTGTNLYPHSKTLDTLDRIASAPWYEKALVTTKPFYFHERESNDILLISPMPDTFFPNIIVIRLSYQSIFQDYCSLFDDNYAVGIYDQNGELLFQHSQLDDIYSDFLLYPDSIDALSQTKNGQAFFYESTDNNACGWTLLIYRPQKELTNAADSFIWIILAIIGICIFVISYISTRLSRQIVTPLEHLARDLEQVQADHLTITIQSDYNDEISLLIRSFNKMAHCLKETINELYVNKLAKQEYRFQILQSQINPHFLYNCLSMINAKALRCDQPDISKIARLLSTFYRTTLNKGHSTTTVYEEWQNITAYIELEKILHPTFRIECHIDEALFHYRIINLIIQPLVENAILHGLSSKEYTDTEPGTILISGKADHACMYFTVFDNGCGMDAETLASITTTETQGYGIRNVDQRIKLYFGELYGISYESETGRGTTAVIRLPLIS